MACRVLRRKQIVARLVHRLQFARHVPVFREFAALFEHDRASACQVGSQPSLSAWRVLSRSALYALEIFRSSVCNSSLR